MGKGKGGKNKKKGKRNRGGVEHQRLNTKTEDQEYAVVTKMLGDCRVHLKYINKHEKLVETMGIIRGKFRRRVWINEGNVVLVALRDYDSKVDIIDKYSDDNVRKLKKRGEIHRLLLDDGTDEKVDIDRGEEEDVDGFDFDTVADTHERVEVASVSVTKKLNDLECLNDTEADINWDEL